MKQIDSNAIRIPAAAPLALPIQLPEPPSGNRLYRDRLFCYLFSNKKNALSLYNAIHGTSYSNVDDLEIITLEDALYLTVKNDVAICLHTNMALFEAQSTVNPNMPLRGLVYFGREYDGWLSSHDLDQRIYGSALVKIPAPSYYIIYNGDRKMPSRTEYRLSDAFMTPSPGYEWTAIFLNVNHRQNKPLLDKCPVLLGYVRFCSLVQKFRKEKMSLTEAIDAAIDICISEELLVPFLKKHRAEVRSMILGEVNKERYEEMLREEGRSEGLRAGRSEGLKAGRLSAIKNMLADGVLPEKIKAYTGASAEEIMAVQHTR